MYFEKQQNQKVSPIDSKQKTVVIIWICLILITVICQQNRSTKVPFGM